MNNNEKILEPITKGISIDEIGVDYYQRPVYKNHVKKIIKNFNVDLVELPKVCRRDNRWECWDGQHTILAAKAMGYTHITCKITEVATSQEAARLYSSVNAVGFSKALTPIEDFQALKHAEDELTLTIDALTAAHGFVISKSKAPMNIMSIRTLETIMKRQGAEVLATVLDIVASCYSEDAVATNATFIKGLAYFIRRNEGISINILKRKLGQMSAEDIRKEAETSRMFKGAKAYENVFRGIYGTSSLRVAG